MCKVSHIIIVWLLQKKRTFNIISEQQKLHSNNVTLSLSTEQTRLWRQTKFSNRNNKDFHKFDLPNLPAAGLVVAILTRFKLLSRRAYNIQLLFHKLFFKKPRYTITIKAWQKQWKLLFYEIWVTKL